MDRKVGVLAGLHLFSLEKLETPQHRIAAGSWFEERAKGRGEMLMAVGAGFIQSAKRG